MKQKFFAVLLLCSFVFHIGYAQEKSFSEYRGSQKYIDAIEYLKDTASTNNLERIYTRVYTIDMSDRSDMAQALLAYVREHIEEELIDRASEEDISDIDKQSANQEIMNLQNLLASKLRESVISPILSEDATRYRGDMSVEGVFETSEDNYELIGNLDNYSFEELGLEGTLSGDISISSSINNEKNEFSGSIEVFSLIENIYVIAKNIEYDGELDEYTQILIQKLNELQSSETYISLQDHSGFEDFNIDIYTDLVQILEEEALFEAYKSEEYSYTLRPTKSFCDFAKEYAYTFGLLLSDSCSNKQYEDMLEDFYESLVSIELVGREDSQELSLSFLDSDVRGAIEVQYDTNIELIDSYVESNSISGAFLYDFIDGSSELEFESEEISLQGSSEFRNNELEANFDISGDIMSGSCSIEGLISLERTDMTGGCDLESEVFIKIGGETSFESSIEIVSNSRYGKNDFSFTSDFISGDTNGEFSLQNTGEKETIPNRTLSSPKNSISIDEFYNKVDDEYFGEDTSSLEYEIINESFSDYESECYLYENGDRECTKYYDDYTEYCYNYDDIEYCDRETEEYYYSAFEDMYYYDTYSIDGTTGEKVFYE